MSTSGSRAFPGDRHCCCSLLWDADSGNGVPWPFEKCIEAPPFIESGKDHFCCVLEGGCLREMLKLDGVSKIYKVGDVRGEEAPCSKQYQL